MKSSEIRDKFLKFFESKGHTIVRSSSLVPGNDPTLLLTNSGMVQFKDVFTGTDSRPYTRATSVQRCVRAGGKHNDLENVGYTARHHTFFEMLGNFSFGDYFKRDAINYAWELLTKVYGLPADKLTVTVYHEDDEAYDIWAKEIGVPVERIIRIGDNKGARYASDNFWQMADTGPCGPCTEIFYDHGADIPGGPPGSPDEDGDRFIEIWNLVFMQFNRDDAGVMHKLPKPCVDTGMGMERLAAVLQHVHSNYEIDLFQALIQAAARETGATDLANKSLRVIADHIRSASFMIVDGIIPGPESHGYVLRRIIRRALRHGHKLGQTKPFFYKLVDDLSIQMGAAYPELADMKERVAQMLKTEEERFGETLENGMKILETQLAKDAKHLDGATAFLLYDTYGFPLDLTADICRERDVVLDEAGFKEAMERQRENARKKGGFAKLQNVDYAGEKNKFVGYDQLVHAGQVVALYAEGVSVQELKSGQSGIVVLDSTPFYAESGGQVGDRGVIRSGAGQFKVEDTLKIQADVFGHHGELTSGALKVGDTVEALVDEATRARTIRNHSATHLMHKALREVLGAHVAQKGSVVDPDRTRFDFSHNAPLTAEQISAVETIVNREILQNQATVAHNMSFDDAVKHGAMALFGEKYGDEVRVVSMGSTEDGTYSIELCGGTHVNALGDIGLFKVVGEGAVSSGIRRVEALTGEAARAYLTTRDDRLRETAAVLKSTPDEVPARVASLLEDRRRLERELADAKKALALGGGGSGEAAGPEQVGGVAFIGQVLNDFEAKGLRGAVDEAKQRLGSGIAVMVAINDGRASVAVGVTADLVASHNAVDLLKIAVSTLGGQGGGGRPDMAQGGGPDGDKAAEAVAAVRAKLEAADA